MPKLTMHFKLERTTKNKILYREVVEEGEVDVVDALYVRKGAGGVVNEPYPEKLVVTIEKEG